MSDRELLEMAAKAAGLRATGRYDFQSGLEVSAPHSAPYEWNPLDNDGDALRLAVELKLDIAIDDYVQVSWWREQGTLDWVNEDCCRRAIVRAAAEIGRAMP